MEPTYKLSSTSSYGSASGPLKRVVAHVGSKRPCTSEYVILNAALRRAINVGMLALFCGRWCGGESILDGGEGVILEGDRLP